MVKNNVTSNFGARILSFLKYPQKNILFSWNFVSEHKMSRYILSYFFGILSILKYVF
jgi:hypothetical protein